jgi:ATP-binding cassette, subfamily B, bacterial
VANRLAAESIRPEDLVLCTNTDIDRAGSYHEQWLAVTNDRVLVCSDSKTPDILVNIPFSEVTEFRCRGAIGSGLLQARVDQLYVDILRYSNRLADRFGKIARKLDRRLHDEPIVVYPDDDIDPRRCRKCSLMLEFPGDVCPRCVNKGAVMARMVRLMWPYRWAALTMMILLIIGISLDQVAPRLTGYLVDHVFRSRPPNALKLLTIVVGVLAGVQCLRMVINIINGLVASRVGTAVTFDMRGRLVDHLQKLSVAYYDRQQVGSLVARVAYDTEALHGFVNQLTGGFLGQILLVVGASVSMVSLNIKLALFALIPAPLVITGSIIFWRYVYPRYYRFWDASSKQAGMLSGLLSGIRVVKALCQEDREMHRFNAVSDRLQTSRLGVDRGVATFNPIMGLVFQLGGWIVWFLGGRDVLKDSMSLGDLIAFFGYLGMFYGPLGSLTQFTNWLTQFVTQAHRIFEILDAPIQIVESASPVRVGTLRGHIEFERVSFGYNRHNPVLRDIDLEIQPGEMVGIVGRSGSGKTTIINLICRFYDVDEGLAKIDGVEIREIAKEELRSQIGVVLQEPFLFRGSIWENVTYGRPEATPEQVITVAKAGNCHDFIVRTAHGYDTWVGERGAGLSGGERQRVSIARVLLTDPRILILDEATSSVDAESEAAIQAALAELVRGRTTIAIAHRLSTLRNANRIMVVDQGKIIEAGTHEELAARGGLYARLLRIQGQMAVQPTIDRLVVEGAAQADAAAGWQSPLPDPRGHHPRWLTPDVAHIHIGSHGALHVTVRDERIYGGVYAMCCFPVRYPREFISLRYLDHEKREIEVGLIRRVHDWPAEAQALVAESLAKRYFIHTILSIHHIEVFSSYLSLDVETDLGPVQFIMRWQHDRAQDYGASGKMLLDTDENRYLIPDIQALPENERRLFQRYIYW